MLKRTDCGSPFGYRLAPMRSNVFLTSACVEDAASKLQRQQDTLAAQQVRLRRQCEAMERCRERLDRFIADLDRVRGGGSSQPIQYFKDRPRRKVFLRRIRVFKHCS